MNQSNKTNQESVNAIQNVIFTTFEIVRGSFRIEEYHVILFILVLFRDGFFNKYSKKILKAQLVENSEKLRNDIKKHVESLSDKNSLKSVLYVYAPILKNLKENLYTVVQYLNEHIDAELLKENFTEIFDNILYELTSMQGKGSGYLFIQPLELTRFILAIAQLPKGAKVYNPFAGGASFGAFLDNDNTYIGQEINEKTWAIGYLRLLAYKKEYTYEFQNADSINYWNPKNEKYDLIVANPPFGMRFSNPIIGRFGTLKTLEHFFLEKGIEDLTSEGRLIAIIPNGILFRGGSEYYLRKYLIKHDLIEMVFSFSGGLLFNTSIPFSVIVINKNKKEKGVVQFINAEKFIEPKSTYRKRINDSELLSFIRERKESDKFRVVGNDEIAEKGNDYDLNTKRYLNKEDVSYDGKILTLGEIVNSRAKEDNIQIGTAGRYIRIRDLKTELENAFLRVDELELAEIPKNAVSITSDSLLIALKFNKLNPTIITFNQSKETVFVSNDIFVLNFESNIIDINYLISELNSEFVQKQVNRYYSGSAIRFISKKDVLKLEIRVLSLDEQQKKVFEYLESLYRKKEEELTAFKRKNNLKLETYKEISSLKHSLGTPLLVIGSGISIIAKELSKITDMEVRSNFQEIVSIIEKDLELVSNLLEKNESEFNLDNYKLKECDLVVFLKEYTRKPTNNVFNAKLLISQDIEVELFESILINANYDLLTILFNNVLDNANRHAFKNLKNKNNLVVIDLQLVFDEKDTTPIALLSIKNNGFPFPENFDKEKFIQKYSKAGDTGNTGLGGSDIRRITEFMNVKFDLRLDEHNTFPTCYEFAFPIKNTKDINDDEI